MRVEAGVKKRLLVPPVVLSRGAPSKRSSVALAARARCGSKPTGLVATCMSPHFNFEK